MNAEQITRLLAGLRFHWWTEMDLQDGIAEALKGAGVEFRREVKLSPRDRVDFLAGSVAIEVKVGGARNAVLRQLARYAEHGAVSAVILVSTKASHRYGIESINGKPIYLASLLGGAL